MVFYMAQHTPTQTPSSPPVVKKEPNVAPEGVRRDEEVPEAIGSGTPPGVSSQAQVEGAYPNGAMMYAESPLHSLAAAAAYAASNEMDR